MSNVLMLWPDITEDIPSKIKENYCNCVDIRNLYKKIDKVGRAVRRIRSELKLSTEMYFDDWIYDLEQYSKIIIHANSINQSVPSVLRKKGYKNRIIYWYWNPVCNCVSPDKLNKKDCEIWSFSKDDCVRYGLRYNSTYYFMHPGDCADGADTDLFFVGADKGRYHRLMKMKSAAESVGLKTDFRIIKDKTSLKKDGYTDRIPYSQVIECVKKAKAIVELLQEGQSGLSLRAMESLFFKKKLITDNIGLINEYYPKDIVLLIRQDCYEKDKLLLGQQLLDFIKQKNCSLEQKWAKYYDFKNWLDRFD